MTEYELCSHIFHICEKPFKESWNRKRILLLTFICNREGRSMNKVCLSKVGIGKAMLTPYMTSYIMKKSDINVPMG